MINKKNERLFQGRLLILFVSCIEQNDLVFKSGKSAFLLAGGVAGMILTYHC